jgi:hypothetical protein
VREFPPKNIEKKSKWRREGDPSQTGDKYRNYTTTVENGYGAGKYIGNFSFSVHEMYEAHAKKNSCIFCPPQNLM